MYAFNILGKSLNDILRNINYLRTCKDKNYLYSIYSKNLKEKQIDQISKKICSLFENNKIPQKSLWSEEDFFLITYADTIKKKKS